MRRFATALGAAASLMLLSGCVGPGGYYGGGYGYDGGYGYYGQSYGREYGGNYRNNNNYYRGGQGYRGIATVTAGVTITAAIRGNGR